MATVPVQKGKYGGMPLDYVFTRLRFKVVTGPSAGAEVTMESDGSFTIGSAEGSSLTLADPTVSRIHCSVETGPEGHLLRDHGSTNGTIVNGARVREAMLSPGLMLTLGDTQVSVEASVDDVRERMEMANRLGELIGFSPAMRRLYTKLTAMARADGPVLLTGETGTGKSLVAKTIHVRGKRASGPFVVVDCGAVAETVIASELFGHVAGAFTGAVKSRKGAFETAHGGTLFLDEIGELPAHLQSNLLRAVQEGTVRPVGSEKEIQVDVRVIAATNRDLKKAVNDGGFRSDLFFRLSTFCVRVPALSERREDIPALVTHFYEPLVGEKPPEELVERLQGSDWPGNVRQLRNAIERAAVLGDPALWQSMSEEGMAAGTSPGEEFSPDDTFRTAKARAIAHWEKWWLGVLLRRHDGNVTQAARSVTMDRKHLTELLKKHGVSR